MKFLPLIWSNLKRKKLRTTLTVLSILVAFILFGILSAINAAFSAGVSIEGANRLIVRHKVSLIQLLPEAYKARMERIPGVERAAYLTWFGGKYQDEPMTFGQFPTNPEDYLDLYREVVLPAEAKKKWMETRTGAIVGRKTAEKYGWKVK